MSGDIDGVRTWYVALSKQDQALVKQYMLVEELKAIAEQYKNIINDSNPTDTITPTSIDDLVSDYSSPSQAKEAPIEPAQPAPPTLEEKVIERETADQVKQVEQSQPIQNQELQFNF
jgi:hypothetical protein